MRLENDGWATDQEQPWDRTSCEAAVRVAIDRLRERLGERDDLRDMAVEILNAAFEALDAVEDEFRETPR